MDTLREPGVAGGEALGFTISSHRELLFAPFIGDIAETEVGVGASGCLAKGTVKEQPRGFPFPRIHGCPGALEAAFGIEGGAAAEATGRGALGCVGSAVGELDGAVSSEGRGSTEGFDCSGKLGSAGGCGVGFCSAEGDWASTTSGVAKGEGMPSIQAMVIAAVSPRTEAKRLVGKRPRAGRTGSWPLTAWCKNRVVSRKLG